jgi:molecular chaperone HscB
MNYFEIFEIPVQLKVDRQSIAPKFFELSRKYHPDYFVGQGQENQALALEKSSALNKAYKTLLDADETIKYVLQLKGLLQEEEKYELPVDFLMEVMDINERLMEAGQDPEMIQSVRSEIESLKKEIYEPVKEIVENYQEPVVTEKELLQVKQYYFKKKYLERINQQLSGKG